MTKTTQYKVENLQGGELLRLHLHHEKSQPSEIVTRFVGFKQEGGYERAQLQEDGATFVWNLRHTDERWLYGVNQFEYASIEEILEEAKNPQLYDKHLTKLKVRMYNRGVGV